MKMKLFPVVGSRLLLLFFGAVAAESASPTQAPSPSTTPGAAPTVTCDFSNPSYSGWCRVTEQLRPGKRPRSICSQVLACLNDVRCIRTYCTATTIRGGWKLEKVETAPKASGQVRRHSRSRDGLASLRTAVRDDLDFNVSSDQRSGHDRLWTLPISRTARTAAPPPARSFALGRFRGA